MRLSPDFRDIPVLPDTAELNRKKPKGWMCLCSGTYPWLIVLLHLLAKVKDRKNQGQGVRKEWLSRWDFHGSLLKILWPLLLKPPSQMLQMKSQLKIMSYKGPAPGMVHMGLQKEASKSFTNTFSSRKRKAGPVVEDPPGSSSRSHKVLK